MNASFFDLAGDRLQHGLAAFAGRWGWYLSLGIFLVILGVIAAGMPFITTMLSVAVLGWILLFAGAGLVLLSFLTARWSGFLLSLATGVLSIIAGLDMLSYPVSSAVAITMIIGTVLLVAGIFRSIAALVMRFPYWGFALVSGIVTFALGAMLLRNLQISSLVFLGYAIGIDLILHGISWITFSVGVHRLAGELGITEAGRRAA